MSNLKPPKTHPFFQRLGALLTFGKIAQQCGKDTHTAEAWARETASNENPSGTGKHNPLDCIFRLIGLAHKEDDRALAQELAEAPMRYYDWLEGTSPAIEASLDELIGAAIKEHSEAIVEALNKVRPNYARAMTEIVQAEIALRDLKGKVQEHMTPVRAIAAQAVANRNGKVQIK